MDTSPKAGAAGKPFDQRLAALLVRPLARTCIRPNHVTFAGLLVAALSGLLLATQHFGWGALLFMAAVFLDHADGELARLSGRSSRAGHLFDYIAGAASYFMMFLGAGIGLSQGPLGHWALALGVVAAASNPLVMFVRLLIERRHGAAAVAHPYFLGFEIEDFIYLIGAFAWLGHFDVFFIAYGLGAVGYLFWQITVLTVRDTEEQNRRARQ